MQDKPIWRLLDSGPGNAAWNMAVDEALLLFAADASARPTLRFFSWEMPSLSIGSFQGVEGLDMKTLAEKGIPFVRRPTGGRAVLHGEELTYSVACPVPSPFFPSDLMGSYRSIGSCFLKGLDTLGIDVSLVPARNISGQNGYAPKGRDHACFSSPSWHEVLMGGKKLIGSAQRRIKGAFLQQGSLLVGLDVQGLLDVLSFVDGNAKKAAQDSLLSKMTSLSEHGAVPGMDALKAAVTYGFGSVLGARFVRDGLSAGEAELAGRLYTEKYSTGAWNLHRLKR